MASVRQLKKSRYWYAVVQWADADGTPRRRDFSTGLEDKTEAMAAAVAVERKLRQGVEKPHQLRAALSRLADDFVPAAEEDPGVWLEAWAASKKREVAPGTAVAYEQTAREAANWLRGQGIHAFADFTQGRATALRDHWAEVSAGSANKKIKHLRIALNIAVSQKRLAENPAVGVPKLREAKTARREFKQHELDKLLATLTGEWKAITLLGLYTGQRLNDLAELQWKAIDLKAETITFHAEKTGALVALPLVKAASSALKTLAKGRTPTDAVFSKIQATAQSSRSNAFREHLSKVGLANSRNKKNADKGKGRATSELSFHSLRHTTTSMLKAAGVPDSIARAIVGHESAAVSRTYTHFDLDTMRAAMAKLPKMA